MLFTLYLHLANSFVIEYQLIFPLFPVILKYYKYVLNMIKNNVIEGKHIPGQFVLYYHAQEVKYQF